MRRLRHAAALAGVATLALSGSALAASSAKITGGNTTLTLSSAAVQALTATHLTATPIAPATASGTTFMFPISGGHINPTTLKGIVRHKGGFKVASPTKSATVRELTIVSTGKSASLWGVVRRGAVTRCHLAGHRHHRHLVCRTVVRRSVVRLANLKGVTRSGSSATVQASLTAESAALLDRLSGTTTFKGGQVIGTVTVSPTFGTYVDPLA